MNDLVCITGATGGLGKAFAVECAKRGWNLFLTDISEDALINLSNGLQSTYGVNVIYEICDLSDSISRMKLFERIKKSNLQFISLFNVAGLDYEGPFMERSTKQIETIIRLNIEATLAMTHEIFAQREKGQTFRLINVCSLAAYYPMPIKALYSSSKRFLLNFSIAFREEVRYQDATVTALCPGGMRTNRLCIESIEAQGFMGRITTKNVGYVASKTIDHALKGHAVYIPGKLNLILKFLGSLISPRIVSRLIFKRWISLKHKNNQTSISIN